MHIRFPLCPVHHFPLSLLQVPLNQLVLSDKPISWVHINLRKQHNQPIGHIKHLTTPTVQANKKLKKTAKRVYQRRLLLRSWPMHLRWLPCRLLPPPMPPKIGPSPPSLIAETRSLHLPPPKVLSISSKMRFLKHFFSCLNWASFIFVYIFVLCILFHLFMRFCVEKNSERSKRDRERQRAGKRERSVWTLRKWKHETLKRQWLFFNFNFNFFYGKGRVEFG